MFLRILGILLINLPFRIQFRGVGEGQGSGEVKVELGASPGIMLLSLAPPFQSLHYRIVFFSEFDQQQFCFRWRDHVLLISLGFGERKRVVV